MRILAEPKSSVDNKVTVIAAFTQTTVVNPTSQRELSIGSNESMNSNDFGINSNIFTTANSFTTNRSPQDDDARSVRSLASMMTFVTAAKFQNTEDMDTPWGNFKKTDADVAEAKRDKEGKSQW